MSNETSSSIPSWLPWVVLALVAITGIRTVSHPDYWLHLEQSRAPLSGIDTLVYASNPEAAANPTWMYDRVLGAVHQLTGPSGVTVLHIIAFIVAFGLLIPKLSENDKGGLGGTSAGLLLAGWLLMARFEPRAAFFAILFPAIFLKTLISSRSFVTRLAILVPAQILWTNMHGSFIFGPLIVAGFLVEEILDSRKSTASTTSFPTQSAIIVAVCALATALNPWAFGLHGYVIESHSLMDPASWQQNGELVNNLIMYPHWSSYGTGTSVIAVNASLAIGAIGLVLFRGKLPWGITLSAIVGALMVVQHFASYREVFAICSMPFLAIAIGATGRFIGSKSGDTFKGGKIATIAVLVVAAGMSFSAMNNSVFLRMGNGSSFGLGTAKNVTPTSLIAILEEEGAPQKVLASPLTGTFLAANFEEGRVAIDARVILHGSSEYTKVREFLAAVASNAETSDETRPDAIVLDLQESSAERNILSLIAAGWRPVFLDGLVVMLVENPMDYPNASDWMRMGTDDISDDVARSRSGGAPFYAPLSHRSVGGGRTLTSLGLLGQADPLLTVAENVNPTVKGLALTRGVVKLGMGDADLAARYLEIAVQNNPEHLYALKMLVNAYELGKRNHEADTLKLQIKELEKKNEEKEEG